MFVHPFNCIENWVLGRYSVHVFYKWANDSNLDNHIEWFQHLFEVAMKLSPHSHFKVRKTCVHFHQKIVWSNISRTLLSSINAIFVFVLVQSNPIQSIKLSHDAIECTIGIVQYLLKEQCNVSFVVCLFTDVNILQIIPTMIEYGLWWYQSIFD